jgi:hypothetical protein
MTLRAVIDVHARYLGLAQVGAAGRELVADRDCTALRHCVVPADLRGLDQSRAITESRTRPIRYENAPALFSGVAEWLDAIV